MEYKQLEFFLAVCEQKSFSRAAEVCYVSQQAIRDIMAAYTTLLDSDASTAQSVLSSLAK